MFKILESVAALQQDKGHFGLRTQGSSNEDNSSENSSNFSNFEYNHQNKPQEGTEEKGLGS